MKIFEEKVKTFTHLKGKKRSLNAIFQLVNYDNNNSNK